TNRNPTPTPTGHRPPTSNGAATPHCNAHANCHSYTETHSDPEISPHTKAPSDPTASSVTGNTRLEKSNQERRNRGKGFPRQKVKSARVATSENGSRASFNRAKGFPR